MKIAVTGGAGFIGRYVVTEAESRGHDVVVCDRAHGCDILEPITLDPVDVVIHLAGVLGTSELFANPHVAVDANVHGSLNVLEWCENTGAGYVGITMPDSSWANLYQATKLCAMRIATAFHRNKGVPVSHVRAFNAYGPGQAHGLGHPQKIIPTFATCSWNGVPIPIWGDGKQSVDLIHAADVAKMLVDATRFGDDEVFDAGTGGSMTVEALAAMVNGWTGQHEDNVIHLPMRAGEEPNTHIRATGEGWDKLDWVPALNYDLLYEAVRWYKP